MFESVGLVGLFVFNVGMVLLPACSMDDAPPKPPPPASPLASGSADGGTTGNGDAVAGNAQAGAVDLAVAEKKFTSTSEDKVSLSWKGKYYYVDKDVTLVRERTGKSAFFKQNDRTFLYDLFVQGAGGVPNTTRFAISRKDADPGDIRVTVNNVSISTQEFQFDAASAQVIFNRAPLKDARIYVFYRIISELKTEFSVGTSLDPASIEVLVNDVKSTDYTYDAVNGNLVFGAAPKDAASIKANFVVVGPPVLKYAVFVPDEDLPNLRAFAKNEPTKAFAVTYAAGQINFDATDFADGMAVVVRYYKSGEGQTLILPYPPLKETLAMKLDATKCTADQFTVTDDAITTNCELPEETSVDVTYSYISVYHQNFSMADVMPTEAREYVWKVWVDGEERTDFTRQENVVNFATALPIQKDVTVKIYKATP